MKKLLVLSAIVIAASGAAQAQVLFSNGSAVNAPGTPNAGLSVLTAPATSFGATSSATQTLADNFAVTGAPWSVQSLDFFGYQTGAAGFTFTNVSWSILAGTDINSAALVSSGTTNVTNGGLVGYRVLSTALTLTNRAIYRINADIPDLELAEGNYFVTFALAGTSASGPFVPPVAGTLGTGNAFFKSSTGTSFFPVTDGGSLQPFDVPFSIQGSVIPEPSTYALMLAGGLSIGAIVRRRRQQG